MQGVVTTSNAWKAVNGVVPGGIYSDMLNDKMWEDVLFAYPSHIRQEWLKGDFILVDGKNTLHLMDTTLNVWLSDLSVPFYIPPGVDVSGTEFLVPIYDGQGRIIKSYDPSGQGQDALANAKKSLDESSANAAKVANVEWVDESTKDAFFHEGFFYQKNAEGKWESEDPNAPKAIKVGQKKNSPTFLFDKNGDLVAADKRNAYKFGMGDYAGYRNNYYRNAFNGSPLGGGFGMMPAGGFWNPAPMWGGGFGDNWGMGMGGFGRGFGFSFGFGMGFGGGWNNGFGCMPPPCFGCFQNRWATGGPAVWNGFGYTPINFGGGYYNDPYYGYDGYGGWKSNEVGGEHFEDVASAEFKNTPVASNMGRSSQGEKFVDLVPVTAPATSKEGSSAHTATSERKAPAMDLPPSHTVADRQAGNSSANKQPVREEAITMGASHGTLADRGNTTNERFVRSDNNQQAPTGANGRNRERQMLAENREVRQSVGAANPSSSRPMRESVQATTNRTLSSSGVQGQGSQRGVGASRQKPQPGVGSTQQQRNMTYGNTEPSTGNGGQVGRQAGRTMQPAPQQRNHQARTAPQQRQPQARPVQPARQQPAMQRTAPARSAPMQHQAAPARTMSGRR